MKNNLLKKHDWYFPPASGSGEIIIFIVTGIFLKM